MAPAMSKADWSWLNARIDRVATASVEVATEVLTQGLQEIDPRLGVEITDNSGTREVVITAGGKPEAFALVKELVQTAPSIRGWSFIALRPPKGFDFEVHLGSIVFGANRLSFQPIDADVAPGQLAIRLFVPNPNLEEWSSMALQMLEAGLGEEAAAAIGHLEVGERKPDSENVYALESLPGYVRRNAGKR